MNKKVQDLIDQRQRLIDKICMDIIIVREGKLLLREND